MEKIRKIKTRFKSQPTLEGAGVKLKRALGFYEKGMADPFLLLDEFHSDRPEDYLKGFPWHPHRGIETITYVLKGSVEHKDSNGNSGVISEGDIQWMTAGSGIIHQEMPKGSSYNKELWGFQLWSNLPSKNKMMKPRYQEIKNSDIPVSKIQEGGSVKIICGEFAGTRGPVTDIISEPTYLDVTLTKGATFKYPVKSGHNLLTYVIEGRGNFENLEENNSADLSKNIFSETLLFFDNDGVLSVRASESDLRFLVISGKPFKEPISWYGPIVMNTEEEIRLAFEEYRNGTFLKG